MKRLVARLTPRSLRARITLAAIAALAVVGVVAGVLLLAAVERDGRRAVDKELHARAEGIGRRPPARGTFPRGVAGRPGVAVGGDGQPGPPPDEERLLAGSGTFVQVASRGGAVVDQRGDVPSNAPAVPATDGLRTVHIDGQPWRSLTTALVPDGDLRVSVLATLAPVEARVAHIRDLIVGLGLAALVLTAGAAWLFTSVAVRPLARLRAGAARVSGASDLGTPLPESEGPDEVRSLARALNEMLARLRASTDAMERALEATRRFAADAGHELRTPLTGLRATLDTLERNPELPVEERQKLLHEVTAEQDRIVHLLEGLQALARGEAAEALPREEVELADLVDAAVFAARQRHPSVTFELDDRIGDAKVYGWPGGLRLVVDNLLDNAALHGRPQGRVEVGLERDESSLLVRVDDDGPGVGADNRQRMLEPFARGEHASVPGTGLGLAIVSQQVTLHQATLRLGKSSLGGLRIEVQIPQTKPGIRETEGAGAQAHARRPSPTA